jgi:ABC-type transporter Mla subunit MlaD
MDGLKKGVVEAATDKALDVFAGKVTDRFNGKVPGFGKYESPAGDMGNLSVGQIRDRLTAAAPDTGDVLQNLRNTAAQRLDTREALGNAAKNAVQGQVQGATLWDPFKKFFGVTKE